MTATKKTAKKPAPKMASRKVADVELSEESEAPAPKPSKAIRFTVPMGGEEFTVSATKYKYMRALRHARDEDEMTGADMAAVFEDLLGLFWDVDNSRERVQAALEDESLDLDDLEVVLKKIGALMDKETNRPLG
jgi:hypothetical protein